MSAADDDPVKLRLRTRDVPNRRESIARFVERYLEEIQIARHEGKSWDAIGRDLRPDGPVKGDTVRKSTERAEKRATSKAKPQRVTVSKASQTRFPRTETQTQLELAMASPEPIPRVSFRRSIDPIRRDD